MDTPENNPDNPRNPASLYEEGDQLHKKSQHPGYTMDPATQGYHGQEKKQEKQGKDKGHTSQNLNPKSPVVLAGAALLLVGAAVLAYRYIEWDVCLNRNASGID